ncbi:MAG: flagellar hook-associated protein 3 [Gammaproteobacteria bacterium]|nr:MAG: flagellar hook-associated protein 3 [Gammaproteobacteria bacterium]
MRISTVTIYEQSLSSMNRQQSEFMKVGEQISTGRRVVNPSDDPQAAAQAVGVSQAIGITGQYTDSRVTARNSLSQEESVLSGIGDAIAKAKTLIVQGVNGTLSDTDRTSVATELEGILQTLIGQANATDGNGRYLFGGFNDSSTPFIEDAGGNIVYVGDSNNREQRIDASRLMAVSDHGEDIFLSVQNGAGYIAEAAATNSGEMVFVGPLILDASDPQFGNSFQIDFVDIAGEMHYSVDGGAPVLYEDGASISFGGLSLSLEGVPADGDSIQVGPADTMNTDLFATVTKALAALREPHATAADTAAFRNTMSTVMRELDNSLDNVLTIQASVGARLNELDVVDGVAENRLLSYQKNLSDLVDLDYASAISEYSLRQVGLQAAQKAFVDINDMSLFNFLR